MAAIRSYTTVEQSRKLADRLPLESADMSYLSEESIVPKVNYNGIVFFNSEEEKPSTLIPCWSLAALLGVLPYPYIEQNYKGKWICRVEHENTTYLWEDSNLVDACVAMIEKLNELNLLLL